MPVPKQAWDSFGKAAPQEFRIPVVPRMAPAPIGSGISTRKLPEARLVEIVRCCQHYEAKCAGLYSAKTPAARCLFDLSREVQDLCRVLVSREDSREEATERLSRSLSEWQSLFVDPSPELQAAGLPARNATPADAANAIRSAVTARKRAEDSASVSSAAHREEVVALRAALRDQAAAAAGAVRTQVDAARRAASRQGAADARIAREAEAATDAATAAAAEGARRASDEEWQGVLAEEQAKHQEELEEVRQRGVLAVDAARRQAAAAREQASEASERARSESGRSRAALEALSAAEHALVQAGDARRQEVEAMAADARGALASAEQRHRASVEASRLGQLEAHSDWLSRRVVQLEGLVESLSHALRKAGRRGRERGRGAGSWGVDGGISSRPFVAMTRPGVGVRAGDQARPTSQRERRERKLGKGRGVGLMAGPEGAGAGAGTASGSDRSGHSRGVAAYGFRKSLRSGGARNTAVLAWVEGPEVGTAGVGSGADIVVMSQ